MTDSTGAGLTKEAKALVRIVPETATEDMLRAVHDGPLGAGEYRMAEEQREWLNEAWAAFLEAAPKTSELDRLLELVEKYKWQVRDTCARAEAAEAALASQAARVEADTRRIAEEEREACAQAVEAHARHWPKLGLYEGGARLAIKFAAERVRSHSLNPDASEATK